MSQLTRNTIYKRLGIGWCLLFPVIWGWLVIYKLNHNPEFTITGLGIQAFAMTVLGVLSIAIGIHILLPVQNQPTPEERIQAFKQNRVSAKMISLFIITISLLFSSYWIIYPLPMIPFWYILSAGVVTGIAASLLAIALLKYQLKRPDKEDSNRRFSFRDP